MTPTRILVCFNPFKGTLRAQQANAAVARSLKRSARRYSVDVLPAADGGPGTLDALRAARGGRLRRLRVAGPLGRPLQAAWLDLGPDALIESAQAIGLERVPSAKRDALASDSFGLGQLLLAVAKAGKRRVYVGLGGSASTDGGHGLARALGWRLDDAQGLPLPPGGGDLRRLARLRSPQQNRLGKLQVFALCDVDNPLHGANGAARVFGPQKGARPAQALRLDAGLKRLARVVDPALAKLPGSGAAGGLGFGLMAFAGAQLLPGAATLLALAGLEPRLRRADWVLTGEGSLDAQSLRGKLPAVLAAEARRQGKPCVALCGRITLSSNALKKAGFRAAIAAPAKTPAQAARALAQAAALFF